MTAIHDTINLDEYMKAGGSPHTSENQAILRQLVQREVVHCCSTMVTELCRINAEVGLPVSHILDDSILWDLCSKTTDLSDELEKLDNEIEELKADIKAQIEITDDLETDMAEFVPSEFDSKEYRALCEMHTNSINTTSDMQDKLSGMLMKYADLENENGKECEALEHWIVTRWFADKLADKGEITGELFDFHIWGRQCSGQAILLDNVVAEIAAEMQVLQDQKYDWTTP